MKSILMSPAMRLRSMEFITGTAPIVVVPQPVFKDQVDVTAGSGSTTTIGTLPSNPQVGDTLLLFSANVGDAVTAVSGGGGTWALVKHSASHIEADHWECPVTVANQTVVTVTYAGSTNLRAFKLVRLTGTIAAAIDQSAINPGSALATVQTAIITPGHNAEIIWAMACVDNTYSSGPTSGFTGLSRLVLTGVEGLWVGYLNQAIAAAISTNWQASVAAAWDTIIASYRSI